MVATTTSARATAPGSGFGCAGSVLYLLLMPSPPTRLLPLAGLALAAATLTGCSYYQVTHPDGTTERISRSEYEEMQKTSRRLGNVPTTRMPDAPAPATR